VVLTPLGEEEKGGERGSSAPVPEELEMTKAATRQTKNSLAGNKKVVTAGPKVMLSIENPTRSWKYGEPGPYYDAPATPKKELGKVGQHQGRL